MPQALITRRTTTRGAVAFAAAIQAERRGADAYNAGDYEAAAMHFREAARRGLDTAVVHKGLATALMFLGERRESIAEYRIVLANDQDDPYVLNNLIFLLDHEAGTTLESALELRRTWWRIYGAPLRATWRPHRNDPDPERPLRIGYVGGDFRTHSASQAFGPVVMGHSEGYHPVCYHTKPAEDELTEVFAEGTEFHRVHDLADGEALARRIREDQIDILVDLGTFSSGGRLLTFCRKPAPIQITAWGYATGTGLPVFDGFFADEVTVPRHLAARGYVEPILYLPSIIPATRLPYFEPVQPLPCLERGTFTFGSFNRWVKVTPAVLEAWADILQATPDSRLLLKEGSYERADVCREVLAVMASRGVGPERVDFRGRTPHGPHLRTYHEVDLALDPFPHSGGVTALEGLWHGVPALTLLGERIPERLSASLATTLQLPAFITETRQEYVETAVALATQFRPQLAEIRRTLAHRIAESPLCVGYAQAVEAHYRNLWRSWCQRQTA